MFFILATGHLNTKAEQLEENNQEDRDTLFKEGTTEVMSKETTHDRTVFSPTLLIGLGGTGSEILLSVREQIKRNNQDILNKFLFIDTDIKTASAKKGYTKIENSEVCMVGTRKAKSYNDPTNSRQYKGIISRFPSDELNSTYVSLLSQGTGAAQIRSLGALAFALDYENVRKNIEALIDDLTKAQNSQEAKATQRGVTIKKQSIIVYIVGSLVGGTGSGSFIDAAVVARDVIDYQIGWDTTVIGVFTLPDGYDPKVRNDEQQRKNIRTNAYSSLMELQYLLDQEYDKISFDYDTGTPVEISNTTKVFNNVYLVDNKNTSGSITLENVYEVVASSIYQDIGTTFGANSQSAQINMGIFNGLAPDPKSGKMRLFSSIAGSSLVYPARRVAEYCTNNSLSEVISDKILGGTESLAKVKSEVAAFLQANDLEDRAPSNQIIDQLLREEAGIITSASKGIDPMNFADEKDIEKFLDELDSETTYFDTVVKQEVNNLAEENKKKLLHGLSGDKLNKLEDIVTKWVVNLAITYNVDTAVKALQTLENVCKFMGEELKTELSSWDRLSERFSQDIDQHRTQLNDLGWLDKKRGKHKDLIDRTIVLYNRSVDAKLENVVKSHAIEIIDILGTTSTELSAKWSNLVHVLQTVQQDSSDEALHAETSKLGMSAGSSRFATEIDITDPGYESEYYKKHYIASSDVYNGIVGLYCEELDKAYSEEEFISWLFTTANRSKAEDSISGRMKELITEKFWKSILKTNIVQYIRNNTQDSEAFLEDKLQMLFELCSPFWQLGSQMLGTIQMPETYCVSVKFELDDESDFNPPKEIAEWTDRYSLNGAKGQILDTEIPYMITVNKRVHGARAYFLSATPRWEEIYKKRLRQAKGRYMLHVHSAFSNIPLLAPTDDESMQAFAKGMALGFIVKRGDWYYYGLEEKYDIATSSTNLEVGYRGHWKTIHDLKNVPLVPEHCGSLWFKLAGKNPPEDMRIGQGRENAVNELKNHEEWTKTIDSAFSEYYKQIGMDLRLQLAKYIEEVLQPAARKATGPNKTLLETELRSLTDWARNNA